MSYSIGWFTTAKDKATRDLFMAVQTAIRRRELGAEISFVFCNRDPGEDPETNLLIRLVNSFNIPLISISSSKFETLPGWQVEYNRQIMNALEPFQPDFCVSAGYLPVVSVELQRKYGIIDIHPASQDELIARIKRIIKEQVPDE